MIDNWIAPLMHNPELIFSLNSSDKNEYAPGYKVNNTQWKKEFSKHLFSIENKSTTVEIHDLRMSLVLPRPIYDYWIKDKIGNNQIDISRIGIVSGEYLDQEGRATASREIYSNALYINVDKIGYEIYIGIELILDLTRKDNREMMSIVDAKYWYSDGRRTKLFPKSGYYQIKKIKGSSVLYVDIENPLRESPLSFDHQHSFTSVLGENIDVKDVEDKKFRIDIRYPFKIPKDLPHITTK
jgi:hypothetical protein